MMIKLLFGFFFTPLNDDVRPHSCSRGAVSVKPGDVNFSDTSSMCLLILNVSITNYRSCQLF